MAREIERWITINGVHVPIYKGEKETDAIERLIMNEQFERDAQRRKLEKSRDAKNKANEQLLKSAHSQWEKEEREKHEQIAKNKEQADKASNKESFIIKQDINEVDRYNKAKRDKYWNRITGRAYEENDKWIKYELPNDSNSKDSKDYVKDKIKEVTGYDNIKMRLGPWSKSSNIYEYYYEEKKIAEFRQGYGKPRGTLKIFKK